MDRVTLNFTSTKTIELLDITAAVERAVAGAKMRSGTVSLFLPHSTAALTTVPFSPSQDLDVLAAIETILPDTYIELRKYNKLPLYMVAAFLGQYLSVPVEKGRLLLGAMQRVMLVEFNGPRERAVVIG